jgi:hypothetical protein
MKLYVTRAEFATAVRNEGEASLPELEHALNVVRNAFSSSSPIAITTDPEPADTELARRACVLVHRMLGDASTLLPRVPYREIEAVLIEATKRGWLPS